jgi:hypothetical protein
MMSKTWTHGQYGATKYTCGQSVHKMLSLFYMTLKREAELILQDVTMPQKPQAQPQIVPSPFHAVPCHCATRSTCQSFEQQCMHGALLM